MIFSPTSNGRRGSKTFINEIFVLLLVTSTYTLTPLYMTLSLFIQLVYPVLAVITVWLDTRENVWARPLSLLGAVLSLGIYYPVKLYARCLLNVISIFLNLYGWYQWLYGGVHKTPLQVSKTDGPALVMLVIAGNVMAIGLGRLLTLYSDADLAYWDAWHMAFWLVAYWMLVQKKLESWLFWLALDIEYFGVCCYKALYPLIVLRVVYIFLAIHGYRSWRKSYDNLEHYPPS